MHIVDQKLRLMTARSISTPARNVSRIAPNPASQLIQSLSCRWMRLPATAPTTISVNATETVSQTDSTDATNASPIHSAAISQTCSTTHLSLPVGRDRCYGWREGVSRVSARLAAGRNAPAALNARSRSYQPYGGFGETPSPSDWCRAAYSSELGAVNGAKMNDPFSTQLSRSRRVSRAAGVGHEERVPSPRLSGRSAFSEETFAGRCGNGSPIKQGNPR